MNPQNNQKSNEPLNPAKSSDLAADLVRQKLEKLYTNEPGSKEVIAEVENRKTNLSKHQIYMQRLNSSSLSTAQIQTAWHEYYVGLPDNEKHEVWREFYSEKGQSTQAEAHQKAAKNSTKTTTTQAAIKEVTPENPRSARNLSDVRKSLLNNVSSRGRLTKKHHLKSLLFGLSAGFVVVFVLMFGLFNERFIAPLITPSKNVSSTPIVIDPNGAAVGQEPKVIIPKINVEIPVVYDLDTIDEKAIQKALERGVVHYSTTPSPGEKGNVAIVGHSSNNILNKGKYKFAFVLLSRLENGDTFTLTKDGRAYVYKVYDKRIVKPTDVSVLGSTDKIASATLITCDPPGTSANRLIVVGEQISPDPSKNKESTAQSSSQNVKILSGNAESLWQRFIHWIF